MAISKTLKPTLKQTLRKKCPWPQKELNLFQHWESPARPLLLSFRPLPFSFGFDLERELSGEAQRSEAIRQNKDLENPKTVLGLTA